METKDKLIAVQRDYIEFLGNLLGEHEAFLFNRGIEPTEGNVKLGKEFRTAIKLLESQIEQLNG